MEPPESVAEIIKTTTFSKGKVDKAMLRAEDEIIMLTCSRRRERGKKSQRKNHEPAVSEGPGAEVTALFERCKVTAE